MSFEVANVRLRTIGSEGGERNMRRRAVRARGV